jgi:hypothetical protein
MDTQGMPRRLTGVRGMDERNSTESKIFSFVCIVAAV